MRDICFLSPKFCGYIGGMETHSYEFAKFFINNPVHPIRSIITKNVVDDGIPVARTVHDSTFRETPNPIWTDHLVNPILSGDFEKDAQAIMGKSNFPETILYLNSPTWLPVSKIIRQKYPSTKIIVRSGGNDIVAAWIGNESDKTRKLEESKKYLVNIVNEIVDHFIVNSNYSFQRTLATGIYKNKPVKTIGGVDCESFLPKKDGEKKNQLTIITAARLMKFKGIEYSIEAFKQVSTMTNIPLRYIIIGDGPERKRLESLAKESSENIFFIGAKSIEEMPKHLAEADIFLHMPIHEQRQERGSSYIHTETMGRGLCEAAAAGLPVVTTAVGGIPEIVEEGMSGFIVPERNVNLAAEKLYTLISSSELRQTIGVQARLKAVKNFDWNNIFSAYKKLFE